ncbi:hypothetical protein DSO57_1038102 [Entomophthora muscae]|uniref:Uncharacterized protein n=1 Tax=Entomophthora muscae TaxID=34485 RepID=A0ACC2RDL7_9FUNG|nr:hypothetical protein DSO57_1038102 [Entomophthora muscae]
MEYYHPHHLDLLPKMKEIPAVPPNQCASRPVVPHTGSWHPFATAVNYLVCIVPIVYMAFQAQPACPVGVQSDSGIDRDTKACFINIFYSETR